MSLQERITAEFPNAKIKVTGPGRDNLNVIDLSYRGARVILTWSGGAPYQLTSVSPGVGVQQALDEKPGPKFDSEDATMKALCRVFGWVDVARDQGLTKAVASLLTEDED